MDAGSLMSPELGTHLGKDAEISGTDQEVSIPSDLAASDSCHLLWPWKMMPRFSLPRWAAPHFFRRGVYDSDAAAARPLPADPMRSRKLSQ